MKNSDMVVNVGNEVNTVVTAKRVGRPATQIEIPDSGSFTLRQLQTVNSKVKPLTVRAGLMRALESGVVTKLVTTVKTGKAGKPATKYMNTNALEKLKATKTEKRVAVAA